jgi:hypothetical protein
MGSETGRPVGTVPFGATAGFEVTVWTGTSMGGDPIGLLGATGVGFETGAGVNGVSAVGSATGGGLDGASGRGAETGEGSNGAFPDTGAGVDSNIGLALVGVRAGPGVEIETGAVASAGARVGIRTGLPTGKSTSTVGPAVGARAGVDTGNSLGAREASAIGAMTGGLGTGGVVGTRVACCGPLEGRVLAEVLGGGRRDGGLKVPLDTVGAGELEGSSSLGVTLSEGASETVCARTGTAAMGLTFGGSNAFEGGSVSDAFDANGAGVKKSMAMGPATTGGNEGSGASTGIMGATAGSVAARTGAPAASIGAELVWTGAAMGGSGAVPTVVGGTAMGATMAAGLAVGTLAASGAVAKDGDPGAALVTEAGSNEGTALSMLPGSFPLVGETSVGPMSALVGPINAGAWDEGEPSMPGKSCSPSVGGS